MTSTEPKNTSSPANPDPVDEMAALGITRVPVDYFHYNDYRYTNLKDALAQARFARSENVSE